MDAWVSLTILLFGITDERLAADVLPDFEHVTKSRLEEYLIHKRPTPVTDEEKARILAALPSEGEVALNAHQRRKLAGIQPVLAFYERDTVITIKVVRLPYACVALHARSVLIIAESALSVLSSSELKAVAAHELAHEYFWNEYYAARERGDTRELQRLELLADGIGIAALARLGVPATELSAALRRLETFNGQFGVPLNPEDYPSRNQRERFHKAFEQVLAAE